MTISELRYISLQKRNKISEEVVRVAEIELRLKNGSKLIIKRTKNINNLILENHG